MLSSEADSQSVSTNLHGKGVLSSKVQSEARISITDHLTICCVLLCACSPWLLAKAPTSIYPRWWVAGPCMGARQANTANEGLGGRCG